MTEKSMRKMLHRIWYHYDQLSKALNVAHSKELISYPEGSYKENAPCASMWEVRQRIENTTKDRIASTIQSSIKSRLL